MKLIFAKERGRVIRYIMNHPNEDIEIRRLARKLEVSPAEVSITVRLLKDEKMIKERRVYLKNPLVRTLKTLLNVESLIESGILHIISALDPHGVGLYGSWANGSNYEDSDIDIWIKLRKHPGEERIGSLSQKLRRVMGREVGILILTEEKLARLKEQDQVFYDSLVFGSINLIGELLE